MSDSEGKKQTKKADFKQILAGVSELTKQQIIEVYVPSIDKEISFKPLNVKQQKSILMSGVDTEMENLSFSNTMNDIILENCLSSKKSLKIVDKALIMLQLRQKAVGDDLVLTQEDESYKLSISQHVEEIRSSVNGPCKTSFVLDTEGVRITGETPDLATDTHYNKQFTKRIKKSNKSKLNLTDVIGDIYIHEMVKYVKSVEIGDLVLDIDDSITVDQTIQVFESLPMKISNTLANHIKTLREVEIKSATNSTLPENVQISIDASLFTSE